MPKRVSQTGSELFIVDNSEEDWKVVRYLHDWCQISKAIDIATGYFEIGSLVSLGAEWQKVDKIRILMGDEVSLRTKNAFVKGLAKASQKLDQSIEAGKTQNDFLAGVPAIVEGIQSGKIQCRIYRKDKFHAKAYITHARLEVVGSSALVGSSNFTYPGLHENIELNVHILPSRWDRTMVQRRKGRAQASDHGRPTLKARRGLRFRFLAPGSWGEIFFLKNFITSW
jgi:phosphatidylserine/phosphatidylglycerophosphate/cardiolipin synthase-like enzyme